MAARILTAIWCLFVLCASAMLARAALMNFTTADNSCRSAKVAMDFPSLEATQSRRGIARPRTAPSKDSTALKTMTKMLRRRSSE